MILNWMACWKHFECFLLVSEKESKSGGCKKGNKWEVMMGESMESIIYLKRDMKIK